MPQKGRSRRHRNKHNDGGKIPNNVIHKTDEPNVEKTLPQTDSVAIAITLRTNSPNPQTAARRRRRKLPKQPQDEGNKRTESQHRNPNRPGKQRTDAKTNHSLSNVDLFVEDFKLSDNCEDKENRAINNKCAILNENRVRLPVRLSNYVMTMRQLYDRFQGDSTHIVEEAASRLEVKGETDARSTVSTQLTPTMPSPNSSSRQMNTAGGMSTHLLLLAVTRLSSILSTEARRPRRNTKVGEASSNTKTVSISTLQEVIVLCKLIAWFCLETYPDEDTSTPGGGGSRGMSAQTTPGASSARRQGSAHSGTRPLKTSSSFSSSRSANASFHGNNNESYDLQCWLGSRMAVDQAAAVTLPDTQLSEQFMRPVIEAVSRFSVYGIDPSSVVIEEEPRDENAKEECTLPSAGVKEGSPADRTKANGMITMVKLRISTLAALCAVLNRFPDADFNSAAFLPLLFPNEDPCAGLHVRHPLLTPILWDPSPTSRSIATLALTALLHKLQNSLQFAEEPKCKHQSFVSLATQGGSALSMIHDVVYWAIKNGGEVSLMTGDGYLPKREGRIEKIHLLDSYDKPTLPCARNDATLWFNVLSVLSIVTAYNRCPHSLQVMLKTLDSPLLRQHLRDESGLPFIAATGFLANVFKNESLQSRVSEHLYAIRDLAPLGKKRDKATFGKNAGVTSHRGNFLITDLLVHATERIEVWRCLVHIARFYPKLIQQHFEPLLKTSCDVVDVLLRQEAATVKCPQDSKRTPESQGDKPMENTVSDLEATLPHNPPSSHHDPKALSSVNTSPERSRGRVTPSAGTESANAASSGAFSECLRAWTHFMGYTWKAFDNNPGDPALKTENTEDRAAPHQKVAVFKQLILRAMQLEASEEVRVVTLRCIAQIGEGCLSSEEVSAAQREQVVRYALAAVQHWSGGVRSEALTALGMWVWQYPVLDPYGPAFLATAFSALVHDSDGLVRSKASFAVSNLTSRLEEPEYPIRESVEHIDQLFLATMSAVSDVNSTVQGHGIRMINNLLQVLVFEELIANLPVFSGEVRECVGEGFLRTLLNFLTQSTRDAKHRWNAAYALGTGLSRTVLFEAELNYSLIAIDALMTVVVRDNVFKVRTQAAHALGKISPECIQGKYCPPELVPRIIRTLCVALMSSKTTENFQQFREQAVLQAALGESLRVLIPTAVMSPELNKILVEYHQILVSEEIV
ncbi:unnamed protein product [Phytomonas sp. Hart1]|nr:unnamed protein product [Phytomonas sp. Hart1]|eukprot:CCW70309.1 unnamed protein product [Phytomonas sp. isolate Hart1]